MHKRLKQAAFFLAAFAATLLVGKSAIVVSTNVQFGGEAEVEYNPTHAALQKVWVPTLFGTNVFLHDKPDVPLHERISAIDGGDIVAESITLAGEKIESWQEIAENLEGELQGPAWLTPARFKWTAEAVTSTTTNIGPVVDDNWAALTRDIVAETWSDYLLDPSIIRNQWDAEMETDITGPAALTPVGDGTYTLSWELGTETGSTATVSGQLGDWRDEITLEKTSAGHVVTQKWFSSFASGGVRVALDGVLSAWTNSTYGGFRFSNYANRTMTNWTERTNGYTLASHCWEENCDLSGVSYLNDSGAPYYKPLTLVASNLAVGVAHFFPATGVRVAWMGKDGQPHASKLVDRRILNYDLAVGRIDPPIPAEICTAYPILLMQPAKQHTQAANNGVKVIGLPPLPVLAMAQGQRAWIMQSTGYGVEGSIGYDAGVHGIFDTNTAAYIRNSRQCAVGGDSGHPCFTSTNGTSLILLGCYSVATGLAVPGEEWTREIVEQAITSMGCDPSVIQWESFENWPTFIGPGLTPGGGGGGGGGGGDDPEPEDDDEPGE